MRTTVVTATLALTAGLAIAGCGSSSVQASPSSSGSPLPQGTLFTSAPAPSSAPSTGSTGTGKPAFTGQSICDALPASGVQDVLTGGAGAGTPSEPQDGVHACAWNASDGKSALVVLLIDNGDETDVDSLDVTNAAAGTDFSGVSYSSKDVGIREVRASYLTNGDVASPPPGLSDAVATVRDVIYEQVFG